MEFIEHILSIASAIHTLVENVKANKKRSRRVCDRVTALKELVVSIEKRDTVQASADVGKALEELYITLQSAQKLIEKYTSANLLERILKSSSHGDEFNSVNERLNDAFQRLSVALQLEQGNALYRVFEQTSRVEADEMDGKEDDAELKKLDKPSMTNVDIRMIKPAELEYELPKKPLMVTSTSELYKGKYNGFTVAIKRYTEPVKASPSQVRSVFNKEVETMRRFESPNILRMFGICVQDEEGPNTQFLIIMEYCEKGSLREVLDSDSKLSWTKKVRMCLDAAQGIYRLHQTEEKSKVHGCINSSKFLVAEGYRVKLAGFELAQTETSLKKQTKPNKSEIGSLCYSSPQTLKNINHYNKECEMYSFGIVLWEIATRKRPFHGFSDAEIYQKVYEEKFKEPLPDDCPKQLADLINACRDYDSFQRPSAGVMLDKLRSLLTQMEAE
ncbi:mixed lineage kinase domain-like protein isoform X2 [Platichthys flesus]|uniref:mixed lineage kinase domain-like protein isoform X2 n=1 Tax=Platichthys flesus TaxID=8260 RepID=UPI002DBB32EB|nr:mixed lineage kinase domain-like protein isoform X2 [Platichthys flesus]